MPIVMGQWLWWGNTPSPGPSSGWGGGPGTRWCTAEIYKIGMNLLGKIGAGGSVPGRGNRRYRALRSLTEAMAHMEEESRNKRREMEGRGRRRRDITRGEFKEPCASWTALGWF